MFTIKDIENKVRELAAASPDCVYIKPEGGGCNNIRGDCSNGSVGCIVGQAVIALGVPRSFFEADGCELCGAGNLVPRLGQSGYLRHDNPSTFPATAWLTSVQRRQDDGGRWAAAVLGAGSNLTHLVK